MSVSVKYYVMYPKRVESPLQCKIFYGAEKPLSYPVSESIPVKLWSKKDKRVRSIQTFPDSVRVNEHLNRIEQVVKDAYNSIDPVDRNHISLKNEIDLLLKRSTVKADLSIHETYVHLSATAKSKGRAKHFKYKLNFFKKFEEEQIAKKIIAAPYTWMQFKIKDALAFVEFLYDLDYAPTTIGDHVKILKRVYSEGITLELHTNTIGTHKKFNAPSSKSADKPALTVEEVKRIGEVWCATALQEIVRDNFYMQCILTLRYGDTGIDEGSVEVRDGLTYLRKRSEKTSTKTVVRCPQTVVDILDRWNNNPPPYPDNHVANKILKILAERAQIDDKFTWMEHKGKKKMLVTKFKHELVTTHTARRTGATNMILAGMNPFYVMKLGGWSSFEQMMGYLKIDAEQLAYELAGHKYFTDYDT